MNIKPNRIELVKTVVADLKDPAMTHLMIAAKHRVGLNFIVNTAKEYGLTRQRGRKTIKPRLSEEQKQENRIKSGRCSVHGLYLIQVGTFNRREDEPQEFTISCCPRHDCNNLYWQKHYGGQATPLTNKEREKYSWIKI
jgi:hypothetical protein